MRRKLVALGLLVVLVGLSGCTGGLFGGGGPSEEQLNENATYNWDTNASAVLDINKNNYTAVYEVQNRSEFELYYRDGLGSETPLQIRALKFQYRNGTVVDASALNVSTANSRTVVELPARFGKIAFTTGKNMKSISTPLFVEGGSYEVILPPGGDVDLPLLANVNPGGYSRIADGDRVRVRWEEVERGPVAVRFYLERDLLIFGVLGGILVIVGLVGGAYYLRQLREIESRRDEVDLDVDTGDDDEFDDGPPPGMR